MMIVASLIMIAALLLFIAAAHAADVVAAATAPTGIDFTPLIPFANAMIATVASLLTAATPVIVGYLVYWLRSHGIAMSQAAQKTIQDRVSVLAQNGLKYAQAEVDDHLSKLRVAAPNASIARAANYAIAQSPDLLKKAGVDVTTEAGQEALVRRIVAESQPNPPAMAKTENINLTTETVAPGGSKS